MNGIVTLMVITAMLNSCMAEMDLSLCGGTAGCLRSPNECIGDSCSVAAMWTSGTANKTINFAIRAESSSYVSIGFSKDKSMGDDSVIDCIVKGNDVILQASYNDGYSNDALGITLAQAGLTLVSSSNSGGFITCEFTRIITVPGQDKVFDLSLDYYVLLAHGSVASDDTKNQHNSNSRIISGDKMKLTVAAESDSSGSGRQSNMHKAHGVLMVAAWVMAAATGMFVARHYKTAWPTSTLLGVKVWFTVHRFLMTMAFLCTIAAFVIIFVQTDGEYTRFSPDDSTFKKAHPIMGIAVTVLVIINPIMTIFRCGPGEKNRAVFDWAHFSVGMSALILAFINIFSGVILGDFADSVMWVMDAYVGFYVLAMLVMEVHKCCTSRKQEKSNAMEMSPSDKEESSQSTLPFKYSMLVIFSTGAVIAFVVMLILILVG